MKLADFQALSFDCYGTLIDWEAGLAAVLVPWAAARGLDLSAEQLLAEYAGFEAEIETQQPSALYPEVLAGSLRRLGGKLGAEVTSDDAARLASSVPDWPAFDDSPGALADLARRFQLIILSNVDRASFAGSAAAPGRDVRQRADRAGHRVVQARAAQLRRAAGQAARLGIEPGRLLHVAQSLFHDHVPAKAAGLPTVWINRRHARPGWGATPEPAAPVTPDWEFESLAAFAAAVDAG